MIEKEARLALEDGSIWRGIGFGAEGTRPGEVVFNTSMTGYQEILTDPSYAGQIVVMTAPQIGNTGVNFEDDEAAQAFLNGFIVREISRHVFNWRAQKSLDVWLAEQNIIGISEIDTRALTRRLRNAGSLRGILSTDSHSTDSDLIEQARHWQGLDGLDLVQQVSCEEAYHWVEPSDAEWEFKQWQDHGVNGDSFSVVVYDYGIKRNTLRRLASYGCKVTVVPAKTSAQDVLALRPDGVLLSNGPGDPSALPYAVEAASSLLGKIPLMGICLGHQILGQAFGGQTYRLKFGHHGGNQPVLTQGRVEISAHNHNFAVDPSSLPDEVEVTHLNLNDQCCEGMRHKHLPALSIQYHPEAAPGPHDADPLFAEFVQLMRDHAKGQA